MENFEKKIDYILDRLSKSKFRSSFKLKNKDLEYIKEKGIEKIQSHCVDFIEKKIAPKTILNDGKQTPTKGHPVFIAQHATATCCRGCIEKWHKFSKNRQLSKTEQEYLVLLIMTWIKRQIN